DAAESWCSRTAGNGGWDQVFRIITGETAGSADHSQLRSPGSVRTEGRCLARTRPPAERTRAHGAGDRERPPPARKQAVPGQSPRPCSGRNPQAGAGIAGFTAKNSRGAGRTEITSTQYPVLSSQSSEAAGCTLSSEY